MNNNRRRNYRPRPQKNNFRRRGGSLTSSNSNSLNNNGNMSFSRNGSMNNIHSVEKTMQKYQQLANHYLRRFNELNDKRENDVDKTVNEKSHTKEDTSEKEPHQISN